ncbi:hypothetical protein ACFYMO_14065 [Streptomyces sp. NPDC007025]|uniref:hypothetical protein n=1 Tax=Streptomyces sp. NPDC007025 TaxID=3364771 RepID=UPI003689A0DD
MATESTRTTQNTTVRSPDEEPADEAAAAAEQRSPAAEEQAGRGTARRGGDDGKHPEEDVARPSTRGPDSPADAPDSGSGSNRDEPGADEPGADEDGGDEPGADEDGGDGAADDGPRAADSVSGRRRDWAGGAVAVLSAGLGLASLTGTSFSDMLRERKSLIGQIESSAQGSGGSAADQVNSLYGAPWHAAAVVNGIFAALAVVVGALLLAALTGRSRARGWVKAVALGGVLLGLVGLLVAGGMYFDLFAAQPEVPAAPGQ